MPDKVRVWMIWRADLVDFGQSTIPQVLFTDLCKAIDRAEELAIHHNEKYSVVPADILPREEWAGVAVQIQ